MSTGPLTSKDTLLATPFLERLACPLSQVDHLRTSSGTSGKPPLFCPRTPLEHMEYRRLYHDFKKPVLSYVVPMMPLWHGPETVSFDPKRAAASVRLARAAGVDSMSLFAFHIPIVGAEMLKLGMGKEIKLIEICGEACSRKLYDYMRATFPNATIIPFYGSTEVEDSPMGVPCRAITGAEPLSLYHPKAGQHQEVINPETGEALEPRAGVVGELVVSVDSPAAPLKRFRMGDMVRVVDEECREHGTWSYTVLGRVASDFVRIPGGMLRIDELERVLRQFAEYVTDDYELRVQEEGTGESLRVRATLLVEVKKETDLESLGQQVAKLIHVGPTFTYQDGVERGLYAPLVCQKLSAVEGGKKHKHLIRA